jgi:hypothetical protein
MIRFVAREYDERSLAQRLSDILCGNYVPTVERQIASSSAPDPIDETGLPAHPRKWQLDPSNNFFLNPKPQLGKDVFELHSRYEAGRGREIAALATVLAWRVGVRILEVYAMRA